MKESNHEKKGGKLPEKVIRIDIVKVDYGRKKLCQCKEPHYTIDYVNKIVWCDDCGAIVDPLDALHYLATHYERLVQQTENLLKQRQEIANYKPHLVVIKELERYYRKNKFSMVPCCPRCGEPFDLSEIHSWSNRRFLKSID